MTSEFISEKGGEETKSLTIAHESKKYWEFSVEFGSKSSASTEGPAKEKSSSSIKLGFKYGQETTEKKETVCSETTTWSSSEKITFTTPPNSARIV